MDSVDMILEDSLNIERINRELSVITPNNLAYVSLSRKASELNSKLMAKNLEYTAANLGYKIGAYAAYGDSKKEFIDAIFDQSLQIPAICEKTYFLSQNGVFSIRLVAYDDNNNARSFDTITVNIPGKATDSRVSGHFYILKENELLFRLYSDGNMCGEKRINLPDRDYLNEIYDIDPTETERTAMTLVDEMFYKQGIIGMEEVREQLNQIYSSIENDKIRGSESEKKSYNFVITGNPGTGKTVVSRLIGEILHKIGVIKSDEMIEADRSTLVSEYESMTSKLVKEVLDDVRDKGCLLFIDEAYSLYKPDTHGDHGQEAIDTLLKDMEDHRGEYSVIIAGYKKQIEEMLENANPGFKSRFRYKIHINDYSVDEMISAARIMLEKDGLFMTKSAESALRDSIEREKVGDTFGNIRTVRELIASAKERMDSRLNKTRSEGTEIEYEDYFLLMPSDFGSEYVYLNNGEDKPDNSNRIEESLEKLNSLTGLASAKTQVNGIINSIKVKKEMERRGLPSGNLGTLHMLFLGNAGTGKTTVARIIGDIYKDMGILKRGNFVECSASDLLGKYLGQSADNVRKKIQEALGGILFIDEAYILGRDSSTGISYNIEALDALIADVENHRDDLVVILAGYSDAMEEFLSRNQGLTSRFPNRVIFEDYSDDELMVIAKAFITNNNMFLSAEDEEPLKNLILATKKSMPDFGNARGVRNIIEKIMVAQKNRIARYIGQNATDDGGELTNEVLLTVTREDIEACRTI